MASPSSAVPAGMATTSVIDQLEYGPGEDAKHGNFSNSQLAKSSINAKKGRSLHSCFCCFRRSRKYDDNIYETKNHQNSQKISTLEKCQTTRYNHKGEEKTILNAKDLMISRKKRSRLNAFRSAFWTLIVMLSVVSGGFFLSNNTSEFLNATVQTTLDGSVPLSEVFFPSVVVCNINQIRKSFFAELGFYENDTLVRIMYEDFIKGTQADDISERNANDPKRTGFHEVRHVFLEYSIDDIFRKLCYINHIIHNGWP